MTSDPAVFAQQVTANVDQIRCYECPTDATSLHLELETLDGTKATVCLNAVEVEGLRDDLGDWLGFVDEMIADAYQPELGE